MFGMLGDENNLIEMSKNRGLSPHITNKLVSIAFRNEFIDILENIVESPNTPSGVIENILDNENITKWVYRDVIINIAKSKNSNVTDDILKKIIYMAENDLFKEGLRDEIERVARKNYASRAMTNENLLRTYLRLLGEEKINSGQFDKGDKVAYGKYKNKRGEIKRVFNDDKDHVAIEIEPTNGKKKKKPVEMSLYKVWPDESKD